MALETASHIADLDSDNPDGLDYGSTVDNHLRLIKSVLLADIPFTEAVTATAAEINQLDGVTGLVDAGSSSEQEIVGDFSVAKASGDAIIQAHAPTGQEAILKMTINDKGIAQLYADATNTYIGHYDSAGDWIAASAQIANGDVSGDLIWTFTNIPVLPASDPTTDNQAARKSYVDDAVDAAEAAASLLGIPAASLNGTTGSPILSVTTTEADVETTTITPQLTTNTAFWIHGIVQAYNANSTNSNCTLQITDSSNSNIGQPITTRIDSQNSNITMAIQTLITGQSGSTFTFKLRAYSDQNNNVKIEKANLFVLEISDT